MLDVQKERDDVVFVKNELLKKHSFLESELAKEREMIKTWTNSGKNTQNILGSGNWKKGLGYTEKEDETESSKPEFVKKIEKPEVIPVRFVAESTKSTKETAKSETKNKSKSDKTKQVNIGLMTRK